MDRLRILYFITSHGYGHAVRTASICNRFPPGTEVTFITDIPERFFQEEVSVSFNVVSWSFDCGCVQLDGVTVDREATLRRYIEIAQRNRESKERVLSFCRENRFDVIVSDIVPFAFEIAKELSIPCAAVCNFTWYDIYKEYTGTHLWFIDELENMREQYSYADIHIELRPAFKSGCFRRRESLSYIGDRGRDLSHEIRSYFGINQDERLALLYTGGYGMNYVNWKGMERLRGWHFLGLNRLEYEPVNFHYMDKGIFDYRDLFPSSDAVISKPGYSTCVRCILNNTPMVYIPRRDFAEYQVLERELDDWGGGVRMPIEDFKNLSWIEYLNAAAELQPSHNGAEDSRRAAETIEGLSR
ncbi:MAG: hypothetical protein ACOCSE_03155 [Chitinivibrionales bacterium]